MFEISDLSERNKISLGSFTLKEKETKSSPEGKPKNVP